MTELEFASKPILESNHLFIENPKYLGWYKFTFYEPSDKSLSFGEKTVKIINKDTIVRLRLPSELPIYDTLRKFSMEERLVGLHRMMIGQDLKKELDEILSKYGSLNEYVETLSEDQASGIMSRMDKIITFDCNKVPFLHIRTLDYFINDVDSLSDTHKSEIDNKLKDTKEFLDKEIAKYLDKQPEFIRLFIDVLNGKMTKEEVAQKSNEVIACEFSK